MDFVSSCKEKLAHFRIKELKDILTQFGLSKQGRKQDLADRILAILSDDRVSGMWAKKNIVKKEDVAKLVDDIYRKMQSPGATELASKGGQGVSDVTINTTFKEEVKDTVQIEKVRCPCGTSLQADSMIKCEDQRCNVWQHIACVIIAEKPMEGIPPPPPPPVFYCELCRLARADPFWVTIGHPLYPVKLTIANVPTDGTSPMQTVEKTFQLTKADRDLLAKPEFELQAWCMLLNDKVPFRMQWPQYAGLQINGMPVRAINRPGSQLLGANGRDDGPIITQCTRDGSNKILLTGCDARFFCLGVRIMRRRTVQHILNLIPKECDGERFEEALARVCRCVGGGAAKENADSDSDLEVVADSIPVNLRCPMSGSRMKIAGRFKPCAHMGCFDLDVFVQMNQRSRKWQCPICLKNYSLESVIIDPYFTRITTKMLNCGEDITEIEVKPDGCWRVKPDTDRKSLGQLGQWHLPDGTLTEVESNPNPKPKPEALKEVKQGVSSGHTSLKLGLKKNRNGIWEVSKAENLSFSSGNKNNGHNVVIPMSSSEDPSINQDNGGGHFGYSATNGPVPLPDADIIVLSDSDEETEKNLIPNDLPGQNTLNGPDFGLFNEDDFGAPIWALPSTSQQIGPGFQLFGSNENPSPEPLLDINDGLVDNPLAFANDDPSLQLFLPTRPPDLAAGQRDQPPHLAVGQVEPRDQPPTISNGFSNDDWISLSLGGGAAATGGGGCGNGLKESSPLNGGKSRERESCDNPFSFPRQKRSVRPRLYLSIETDSEEDR